LHGWLDNAATYDGLAPLLGERTFVALDFPGHGRSDHLPPFTSYAFVEYVAAVAATLDQLGWDRVDLVGHSLGAAVSAVFAGTMPARVRRLVLLEGLGPLAEPDEGAPARLQRALQAEARHHRRSAQVPVYEDLDAVLERLQKAQSSMAEASARTLLERGLETVEGGVTWRSDRRLRHPSRFRLTEEQVLAFLRMIEAPTVLVRAKDGLPFASELAHARAGAVDDIRVVEVEGGHHVHLDAPERVAPAVLEHLDAP
jgi:pimeloyl-ACP methyl ester carboxylesterase